MRCPIPRSGKWKRHAGAWRVRCGICGTEDVKDSAAKSSIDWRWCPTDNITERQHLVDVAELLNMRIDCAAQRSQRNRFTVVFDAGLGHELSAHDAAVA